MNKIDEYITATAAGLLAALITTSFVLYVSTHNKTEECFVSLSKGNVTHVTLGKYQ